MIDNLETIQVLNQTNSFEFTLIAPTIRGTVEQITLNLNKKTQKIKLTDLRVIKTEPQIILPSPIPSIQI